MSCKLAQANWPGKSEMPDSGRITPSLAVRGGTGYRGGMTARLHRRSALLLLALILSWIGGVSAHDGLAHAGECGHHGEETEHDACDLFHHAVALVDAVPLPPTPAFHAGEPLAARELSALRGRLPLRGTDRGPPALD